MEKNGNSKMALNECPTCGAESRGVEIEEGVYEPLEIGSILMCPFCATLVKVVPGFVGPEVELLTDEDIEEIPVECKFEMAQSKVRILRDGLGEIEEVDQLLKNLTINN